MTRRWFLDAEPAVTDAVTAALRLHARFEGRDYRAALDLKTITDDAFRSQMESVVADLEAAPQALESRPDRAQAISDLIVKLQAQSPLDDVELQRISESCAMFTRLHMGQWDIVLESLKISEIDSYCDLRDRLLRRRAKGVSVRGTSADITWDVHQVVRRHLAYLRHPEGGWQNVFDPPLKSSPHKLATLRAETDRIATAPR